MSAAKAGPGLFLTGRQILKDPSHRGARRLLRGSAARDLGMRADILRIAAMEATIRLMASVGPVGEVDIAQRFGLSMPEACRLLNGMVEDGDIRPGARKRPDWLEQQNAKSESFEQTSRWQERFAEPYWDFYESLSLAIYQMPEKLHAITPDNYRRKKWYSDEHFEQRRKEFLREWQLGTIKAFIRGKEVVPAAAVDPFRLIEDPDLVFEAATIKAKLLKAAEAPREAQSTDLLTISAVDAQNPPALPGKVLEEETRLKLKAIVAFYQKGGRSKGMYRNISSRSVSPETEFAYRIMIEVRLDLKCQHNAGVARSRSAKADLENVCRSNRAPPREATKLPPQPRKLETGFSAVNIKKLVLALEKNEHPWLISGDNFKQMLNSPGVAPPDIDNEPCE